MGYIKTYTGAKFNPLDPKPEDINIVDIAHALSMTCRYGGHSSCYYSVGQHSVLASELIDWVFTENPNSYLDDLSSYAEPFEPLYPIHAKYRQWALLHDAAEAYISDIPTPAKIHLPQYSEMEDKILQVIIKRYGLKWPMPIQVKKIDKVLLVTEARDLINLKASDEWGYNIPPLKIKIEPWSINKSKAMFLEKFYLLGLKD